MGTVGHSKATSVLSKYTILLCFDEKKIWNIL